MASSFDTVWVSLKIIDFVATYTTQKNFDDFFELDGSEENIDACQPHLTNFVEHSFATPLLKTLKGYIILLDKKTQYKQTL